MLLLLYYFTMNAMTKLMAMLTMIPTNNLFFLIDEFVTGPSIFRRTRHRPNDVEMPVARKILHSLGIPALMKGFDKSKRPMDTVSIRTSTLLNPILLGITVSIILFTLLVIHSEEAGS